MTYFLDCFENLIVELGWVKEKWKILLRSRLTGRALKAFNELTPDDFETFENVKAKLLKVYALVTEAYRVRFRKITKQPGQTFVELAYQQRELFKRWVEASNATSYDKLRELILVENFKNGVHNDLKNHLDQASVETLSQAAQAADNYALTHKVDGVNSLWARKVYRAPPPPTS